ncbi:hypothetical protein QOZ80_9AG0692060 [Eleusine coracana subsp. coracana]|nr:hypothetical protein QOZ80_9AG0692060 [Eleusine coracana subsp. coracana]
MALWNGLGQAATVAQLGGIDAAGLISMIVVAVQTVQRNKVECQLLANHVMLITDLLQLLEQSEMMRRPQIRRPLDGLEDTLCQAYMLVTSCQKSNVMFRFIMAGNLAQQFRDVRDRIDSYLRIYPLISHIDTRYFITELYSRTHPSGAEPQVSEEMLGSSGHLNPDSRTKGSTSSDNGVESVELQTETEPLALEVQQNDGYGNVEVFPNRKHRFRWLLQWNRAEASTQSIRRLIGHVETGSITIFKFSKLAASTNNFSSLNIIGTGGFGIVFKGVLPNGVDVAIKTYSSDSNQGLPEFQRELQIMPKLHHVNIVKLLGCCIEGGNRILVYEYICNGSLDRRIYGKDPTEGVPLSWPMRFRIIEGIAQGALYLNHHSRPHALVQKMMMLRKTT